MLRKQASTSLLCSRLGVQG